jgi:hypothetical protein
MERLKLRLTNFFESQEVLLIKRGCHVVMHALVFFRRTGVRFGFRSRRRPSANVFIVGAAYFRRRLPKRDPIGGKSTVGGQLGRSFFERI